MSKLYDETVDQLAAALYSLLAVELMEWSDVDEPTKQWWRKAVRKIIDAVPGIAVVDRGAGLLPLLDIHEECLTSSAPCSDCVRNEKLREDLQGWVKVAEENDV